MSGLCVVAGFDGAAVDAELVERMAAAAPHRGRGGAWSQPGAAAVQLTRPLASGAHPAHQPVVEGELVCVADARIDACDGVPRDDDRRAPRRSTAAEIILAAYRRWGVDCAAHLIGDFAFAIWDEQARRLFAARDPMGSRTLFTRVEPGRRALVASEAKQLLAVPDVPRRLNETALLADIAGLYALPQMSHYEGIDQLAPGHAVTVDTHGHRTWRYWDIDHSRRLTYPHEQDYADHFREVFSGAVADRLRTARPAGMFLSGGLDSTATAGVAARVVGTSGAAPSLDAFSWAFDALPAADERAVSAPLAQELGVPVTDVPADDGWPLHGYPDHGPDEDDPYVTLFEPLFERTLLAARDRGVGLMLTSDRGDELTGNWVYDDLGLLLGGHARSLSHDLRAWRQLMGASAAAFARERLAKPLVTTLWPPGSLEGVRARLRGLGGAGPKPLAPWVPAAAAQRLALPDVIAAAMPVPHVRGHARLQRYMSVFDVISLRIGQVRSRTWARFGMDYADPWADRRIAEFVCAAPQWIIQRHTVSKKITRDAMRGILPDDVRCNPAASGFPALFDRAFKEHEVATVRSLLTNSRAADAGLLDAAAVLDSYETYRSGGDLAHDFWFPLTVEMWLRRWWD